MKQLWSQRGTGVKIQLQTYDNDEAEAREIVVQIEFLRLTRRASWQDCAILFRTNQQSRPLETELRKAGVRYHLIGGQSFFDRREVKDFLAYLKMFINPHDDISLLRIANVPARGLSDVTMERLLGASHESSVFSAMKNPLVTTTFQANTRKSLEAFVEFIERTHAELQSGGGNLQFWANKFLDEIGYFNELRRSEKDVENGEARVRNLKELIATMDQGAAGSPLPADGAHGVTRPTLASSLETFLENVTLDSENEDEEENKGDAVTLITMHSCKGLEFPHVYIVGLEDGLLPHSRSKVEGTMDEERRLFYVAVTRAMLTLTISHCGGRKKYGQLLSCQPSPFLKELPEELVEHSDENPSNRFPPKRAKIISPPCARRFPDKNGRLTVY
ncbi:MAG: ATP-dependent helicase [Limisphaerales bacterium]